MNRDEYQQIYPGDRLRKGSANAKRMSELVRDLINIANAFFIGGERATVPYLQGDQREVPLASIFRRKFGEWLELAFDMSEMFHSIYDYRSTYGYDTSKWEFPPTLLDELADLRSRGVLDDDGKTLPLEIKKSVDLIPHDYA